LDNCRIEEENQLKERKINLIKEAKKVLPFEIKIMDKNFYQHEPLKGLTITAYLPFVYS